MRQVWRTYMKVCGKFISGFLRDEMGREEQVELGVGRKRGHVDWNGRGEMGRREVVVVEGKRMSKQALGLGI